jgi:hypothetical protein
MHSSLITRVACPLQLDSRNRSRTGGTARLPGAFGGSALNRVTGARDDDEFSVACQGLLFPGPARQYGQVALAAQQQRRHRQAVEGSARNRACRRPARPFSTGPCSPATARFQGTFAGAARSAMSRFASTAYFEWARFTGETGGNAELAHIAGVAQITYVAWFDRTEFNGRTVFTDVLFTSTVSFRCGDFRSPAMRGTEVGVGQHRRRFVPVHRRAERPGLPGSGAIRPRRRFVEPWRERRHRWAWPAFPGRPRPADHARPCPSRLPAGNRWCGRSPRLSQPCSRPFHTVFDVESAPPSSHFLVA